MDKTPTIFLLTGSNIGDRQAFLQFAIRELHAVDIPVVNQSAVFETEAWGNVNQPPYLNQAIQIQHELAPMNLLDTLKSIERKAGRLPDTHRQSRVLDIDILFYNNLVIHDNRLKIPHPQLEKRNFALVPLMEIAPNFVHPIHHKTITRLYWECTDMLNVTQLELP